METDNIDNEAINDKCLVKILFDRAGLLVFRNTTKNTAHAIATQLL